MLGVYSDSGDMRSVYARNVVNMVQVHTRSNTEVASRRLGHLDDIGIC